MAGCPSIVMWYAEDGWCWGWWECDGGGGEDGEESKFLVPLSASSSCSIPLVLCKNTNNKTGSALVASMDVVLITSSSIL